MKWFKVVFKSGKFEIVRAKSEKVAEITAQYRQIQRGNSFVVEYIEERNPESSAKLRKSNGKAF